MSSDEKQLVVQKLEKLAFEGPVYARAGFNRLWNQVTGYGVPRHVEGFQTVAPADQAKAMLATFFGLWNAFPTGFTKATDINTMVATTWKDYVSATTADFTGTSFSSLASTPYANVTQLSLTFSYSNPTKTSTITINNIKINRIATSTIFTDTINVQTLQGYVAPSYGACKYPTNAEIRNDYGGREIIRTWEQEDNCYFTYYDMYYKSRQDWKYKPYNPGNPGYNVDGTGNIVKTLSLPNVSSVWQISFSSSPDITFTKLNNYSLINKELILVCHEKLIYDFNNIYTALLIDLYTGINTRHSTTPTPLPVPYTAPTFTPAINTTTDRTNAMAGTNTDTIKNNYLSNYLPGLYFRIYQQTWQLLSDMNASWSSIPSTVRTSTFSAIPNLASDFATINGMASAATVDNVVTNIRTITNFYNTYASNYTNVMRQGTFYGYIVEFLTNLYTPALTYINSTDLTGATQTLVTTAGTYINAGASTSAFTTATNDATKITSVRGQFETAIRNVLQTLVNSLSTLSGNPSDFVMPPTVATAIATPPTVPTNFSDLATFRSTILGHYVTWTTAMQTYLRTYIDAYGRNATAAGATPALDGTVYKGYVDLSAAPWQVRPGNDAYAPRRSFSVVPNTPLTRSIHSPKLSILTGERTTLTDELNAYKNGEYVVSANTTRVGFEPYRAFNVTDGSWTGTQSGILPFLQIQLPFRTRIWGYTLSMPFGNFFRTRVLQGSNDGITFDILDTNIDNSSPTVDVVMSNYTMPYNHYRIVFSSATQSMTTGVSVANVVFYEYTGIVEPTKIAQLRSIFNLFRDANAAFEAIGKVRDFYNESYTKGVRYLSAADITNVAYATPYASATLTLQQVAAKCLNYLNANGTTKNTTLQAGDASFTDLVTLMDSANARFVTALIDRYFATLGTWQTRGVTRPAGPTDGTADKAAVATTLAATRTTYLGLWATLLESLKTRTKAVLNQAKDLQTWKTTATTTSYTFASNPSISAKGILTT